jgi:hypothetical protein
MRINDSVEGLIIKDYYGKIVTKIDYKYFNLVETVEAGQYRTAELSIDLKNSADIKLNYKIDIKNNTDGKYIRYVVYRFVTDTEDPNKIVYYLKEELAIVAELQTLSESIGISEIFGWRGDGQDYIDNFADSSHIGLLNTVRLNEDHSFSEVLVLHPRVIYNDTGWEKTAQRNTTGAQTSQPSAQTNFSYNPNFWVEKPDPNDARTWRWHWDNLGAGKSISVGSSTIYPNTIEFGPTRNQFKNYSMSGNPGDYHYSRVGLYVPTNNETVVPASATMENTDYYKLKYKIDGVEYTNDNPKFNYTTAAWTAANKFMQRLYFEANRGANICGATSHAGFDSHWLPSNNDHFVHPELNFAIEYDVEDGSDFSVHRDKPLKNPDGTNVDIPADSPLYRYNPMDFSNYVTMMDMIKHINTNYINNIGLTCVTMEYDADSSWLEIHTNYLNDGKQYTIKDEDFQITFDVDQSDNKIGMVIGGASTDETRLISAACYGYLNQFRTDMNETNWHYGLYFYDYTHGSPYTPGYKVRNSEVAGNNKTYGCIYTIQNYWNNFGVLSNDPPYVPLRDKQKPLIRPTDQIVKDKLEMEHLYKYGAICNINGQVIERYRQFDLSKAKTGVLQDLQHFYFSTNLVSVDNLISYENAVINMDLIVSEKKNNMQKEQVTLDIKKFINKDRLNLCALDNINIKLSDIYVKLLDMTMVDNIKVNKTVKTLNQPDLSVITFNKNYDYEIFNMPI